MKTLRKGSGRLLGWLLTIVMVCGLLLSNGISVKAEGSIDNNGYPYGKDMSSSTITLICEATGAQQYQWQVSDAEGGTYTDIASATAAEYTFGPENLKWYRCMVGGTPSKAVQAVKPGRDGRTWTNSDDSWYLSNGKVAYFVSGTIFDIVGEYQKGSTTYMLCTSFNRNWQMYGGNGVSGGYYGYSQSVPQKIHFSFDDLAVNVSVKLGSEDGNFAFGCDTQLGNYDTSGDYSDSAALVAALNGDKKLKHIAMVGAAAVNDETDPNAPAFVIEPQGNPLFWIGLYSDRTVYGYNENENKGYTKSEVKKNDDSTGSVVTIVQDTDSGMTMSWQGVDSVQFAFKVGTAKETGAVSGNVNYLADTIDDLEANTVYTIEVKDANGTTTAKYTIKSDANGSIPLAGKDQNGTEYDLTGKKIVISKNGSDDEPATMEIEPRPSENNEQPGTTDYAKPEDITKAETEVTKNTITIIPSTEFKKNQQYRLFNENGTEIDGQEWMSIDETGRLTFTGLTEGTTYLIRAIIPATTTTPRSYISDGTAIQTISNAAAAIVTANNRTYDGTDQPLVTVNGGANGGTMYYAIGNTNGPTSEYTPSIPTATEVGTYYVWYKAVGDTDHIDSNADCVKVEILEPASVTVTYKVINGTWSDGTTTDITETVQSGSKPANVPTGMKAASGYTGGAWDTNPAEATITEATTFTYTFTAIPIYTVTVTNDGHGTGSATPASGAEGTEVTLNATPAEGYAFKEWQVVSGGVTVKDNKFTIGTANVEIKAVFEEIPADVYTVTVTNDGHGTGSATPTSGVEGTEVTLAATAAKGYQFKEWQVVSGGVTIAENKFAIGTANVEIKAVFEEIPATVYTFTEGTGAEWTKGTQTGQNFTITGTPDTGIFDKFTGLASDGSAVSPKNYTATSGSVKLTLKAEWLETLAAGKHTLTANFTDGKAETSFTVKDAAPAPTPTPKPKKVPRTGDGAPLGLWIGLIAVGLIGLGTFIAMKRRTQKK